MSAPELIKLAVEAALEAGKLLRQAFRKYCAITVKSGHHNLVTEFDKAAEDLIIGIIKTSYPSHNFIAEESGITKGLQGDVQWIIDPLDGTLNFVKQIPFFAVNIAAYFDNNVQVAVTYLPMTDELFMAERGKGAYLNGEKIKVGQVDELPKASIAVGFPYHTDQHHAQRYLKLIYMDNPVRDLGSAAAHLAYLAAGRFDIYWIAELQPWDMAPGMLLVEEAGGKVTTEEGTAHPIFSSSSLLATNGPLHDKILQLFKL